MISDKYIHSKVEDKIYAYWEKNKLFKPQKNSKKFSKIMNKRNIARKECLLLPFKGPLKALIQNNTKK